MKWHGEVGLLFVVVVLFFVPHWVRGEVYGTFDLGHITIPLEDLFARYQRAGEIPVWAPELQGGFPLMANGFQSFFYPPHFILRAFFPGVWVVNVSLLLHATLGAGGMWWLLRRQGLGRSAAWIGGLLFAAGGYMVGRITLTHLFFPAAWIPLIVLACLSAWRKPTVGRLLFLAVVAAAQVFSGHIQMVFYTALLVGCMIFVLVIQTPGRSLPRRVLGFGAAGIVVGLLVAVHILPVQELLPQTRRGAALEGAEAFDVSYPPRHLMTWVYPRIFGSGKSYVGEKNEPELMTYFGVVGLVAGVAGLTSRRFWKNPLGQSAAVWLVVGAALAGGAYSPLFMAVHRWPTIIAQLANPARAIVLVHIGWTVAAAFGWLVLWQWVRLVPLWRWLPGLLALWLVAEVLVWGVAVNPRTSAAAWQEPARVFPHLNSDSLVPRVYSHTTIVPIQYPEFGPTVGPVADQRNRVRQTFVAQRPGLKQLAVEFTWHEQPVATVPLTLELFDQAGAVIRSATAGAETIRDGEAVPFRFSPMAESEGQAFSFRVTTPLVGRAAPRFMLKGNHNDLDFNPTGVAAQCDGPRCVPLSNKGSVTDLTFHAQYDDSPIILDRELLLPLLGEGFGVEMVRGHLTLQLDRVVRYLYELGERGDFLLSRLVGRRTLLDRFSVGTVVASYEDHRGITGMPGLSLAATLPGGERNINVYHNGQAYPKIQLARSVVVRNTAEAARAALIDGEVPKEGVVIEGIALPPDVAQDASASAQLTSYEPRQVDVTVRSDSSQLLVLRDVFYTGWHAFIDEQSTPIYYVDSLFRGVVVPSGEHTIRFVFHSVAWERGVWISGLAWVGVLLLALALYVMRVRKVARP